MARGLLSVLIGGCVGAVVTSLALPDLFQQAPAASGSGVDSEVTAARSLEVPALPAVMQADASAGSGAVTEPMPALVSLLAGDGRVDSLIWDRIALTAVVANPLDALAAARAARNDLAYVRLFELWAVIDPPSVLAYVSNDDWVDAIGSGVLRQLAAFDPQGVLQLARKPGLSAQNRDESIRVVAWAMADRDLSFASSFATGLEPGSERDAMLSAVAVRYANEFPEAAWEWLKAISPPPDNVQYVIGNLLMNLVDDNPHLAIDILLDPTGPRGPGSGAGQLPLLMFNSGDYQMFVDRFFAGNAEARDTLGRQALQFWVGQAPDEATRWAQANLGRPDADLIVTTVAALLIRNDTDAAVSFAGSLRGRPEFQSVLHDVASAIDSDAEYARVRAELSAHGVTLPERP